MQYEIRTNKSKTAADRINTGTFTMTANFSTQYPEIANQVKDLNLNQAIALMLAQPMPNPAKRRLLVDFGVSENEASFLLRTITPARANGQKIKFTFGVEIECLANHEAIYNAVTSSGVEIADHFHGWMGHSQRAHTEKSYKIMSDGSVYDNHHNYGSEVVTPVLKNTTGFKDLETVCKCLNDLNTKVNKTCGLHVHVGAADLTDEQYSNVFVNYAYLEAAIDQWMGVSRREDNADYARGFRNYKRALTLCHSRREIMHELGSSRYYKVNPQSYAAHKTIEFRQHHGTTNFEKIKAWVLFLGKLVEWSKTNRLDHDICEIEAIPFITSREKSFFKTRKAEIESRNN